MGRRVWEPGALFEESSMDGLYGKIECCATAIWMSCGIQVEAYTYQAWGEKEAVKKQVDCVLGPHRARKLASSTKEGCKHGDHFFGDGAVYLLGSRRHYRFGRKGKDGH